MKFGKDRVSKNKIDCLRMVGKLEPQEFLGICKILGIEIYKKEKEDEGELDVEGRGPSEDSKEQIPKSGEELIAEVAKAIGQLNRTRSRNLHRLLKAATKEK